MQMFKYQKDPTLTQKIKKEFLIPHDLSDPLCLEDEMIVTEHSTGPYCLK